MNEERDPSQSKRMDEATAREIVAIAQGLDDWNTLLGRQFGPLSRPQRRMLRLLNMEQGVRVGDLGEELGLTTAGTTRMLDKLEALGYAARARDQRSDQRQVYVTLTAAGQSALQDADEIFLARVQSTLSVLDEAELATLAHLLRTMNTRASTSSSEQAKNLE
jgi:DNA-binding MarR family transcriptional regulator